MNKCVKGFWMTVFWMSEWKGFQRVIVECVCVCANKPVYCKLWRMMVDWAGDPCCLVRDPCVCGDGLFNLLCIDCSIHNGCVHWSLTQPSHQPHTPVSFRGGPTLTLERDVSTTPSSYAFVKFYVLMYKRLMTLLFPLNPTFDFEDMYFACFPL